MPLSKQEEDNAKAVFDALDGDGAGKITTADLKTALEQAGFKLTAEDLQKVMGLVDADGSGSVTYKEWIALVEKRPIKTRIEAALRKLFAALDADGTGFITAADLRKLVDEAGMGAEVTDDEIAAVIGQLDDKGDGKVSFDEFMSIFTGA